MRIIVWGINYWPEVTGIAPFNRGLCRFLTDRGNTVCMVTTFAYYPTWRKAPADRNRLYRTDTVEGVPVHRCWHYVPARVTMLRRVLHELSFGVTSLLRVLSLARADLYIVVSPPLVLGPLAWFACLLKRSRYVFHVQDLQPDAAVGLGMVPERGLVTSLLRATERFSYRHASLVTGISTAMVDAFARKGVPEARRHHFPNWVELGETPGGCQRLDVTGLKAEKTMPEAGDRPPETGDRRMGSGDGGRTPEAEEWRERHGIPRLSLLASYSGNLGRKQGLEVILDAAELTAADGVQDTPAVFWVLAGDGAMRGKIEERLRDRPLPNLRLLPLLPDSEYRTMLAASDVCVITQASGTGGFFLPSKLLTVLAAGRPVVVAADRESELGRAVTEGAFGVAVPPEDPVALARCLTDLAARRDRLSQLGLAGRRWVRRFDAEVVLGQFAARLEEMART